MIQHLLLLDNTLTLILPTHTTTITPFHLNYWKIRNNLDTITLTELNALLTDTIPETGLYQLYQSTSNHTLVVLHTVADHTHPASINIHTWLTYQQGSWRGDTSTASSPRTHIGVFKTLSEIRTTFPEYFI